MNTLNKSLYEALNTSASKNGQFVVKHLSDFGIREWSDCTKVRLMDFTDYLCKVVCQSSAHNYIAVLKSVLNRYKESGIIPCDNVKEALVCKNQKAQKVYLNEKELDALEKVNTLSEYERFVKLCFLISAKTGMRISDALEATSDNVTDGCLTYVSIKTKIQATVPVSEKVNGWIEELCTISKRPNKPNYELIIKRLCQRAGIEERTKVFKAGKTMIKKKYELITSHTARVSFCTILAQKGVPIMDICILAGHSSPSMTANYIVRSTPKLNEKALSFLK